MPKQKLQLDTFLPYHLVVVADMMSRRLARVYAEYDLTIPEWRILAQLSSHHSLIMGELGKLTNMEKARVTRAIILMEKKKLIMKKTDKSDGRVKHIVLTQAGKTLFTNVEPAVLKWDRTLHKQLGNDVYQSLLMYLKDIQVPYKSER